jgi:predicted ATP-grasp superfamily ATP-dependent carboligase
MTKALHLCRAFSAAGHRAVLVETHKYRFTGHRFSRAVDAFHVVPPPTDPGYAQALSAIAVEERVDVYVPVCSPVASRYDALAAETLAEHCRVLHADVDLVDLLDDKYRFARAAAELGLGVPDTHLVTDPAQVAQFDFADHPGPYVLKNLAYDPVNRLDLTRLPLETPAATARFAASKPASKDRPWILQGFVAGREWCTHTTAIDGRVAVYVCCPSSAFQVNYESVDNPAVEAWVRRFVAALRITGQVSFDFIEDADGVVRAIECNPRTHSAVTVFQDLPALARAYLDDRTGAESLLPPADHRPTYWLYHELWRLLTQPAQVRDTLRTLARGTDAVYDRDDPLPFLLLHHLQIPKLLLENLVHGRRWTRIDFNIGKLVEPGGD